MNYEKKYKEALELARDYYKANLKLYKADENVILEDIFPELKESEDERIRKALIRFHKSTIDIDGIKGDEIVAWLEKQGEQKPQRMISAEAKEAMYDKPAWSEDETSIAIKNPDAYKIGFADGEAHAKEEMQSSWSEEDKNFMYDTLSNLTELKDRYGEGYGNVGKCIDWLKSLKDRHTWKPSDEQVHAFEQVYDWYNDNFAPSETLTSLYNDLKKLKGE